MNLRKGKTVPAREKRLNTLSAYLSGAKPLLQELQQDNVQQRIRTFAQAAVDDVISALRLISGIKDAAVVIHGPRGCSASQLYFNGQSGRPNRWIVTNLDEKDTIMGGEASLREAIIALYRRHHPSLLFIVATPVVAINNDDVFSVVEELREELGVAIIPVFSDGFKSKTGLTGYDAALHALLKYIPFEQETERQNFVNLLSVAENRQDIEEIERLGNALGLSVNLLPQTGALRNFIKAPQAKASIGLNADDCDYLGRVLEENDHVEFLRPDPPIGMSGTYRWLAALGKLADAPEKADEIHARESGRLKGLLEKQDFSGLKIYINLPAATAWGMAELVEELGATVAGLTVDHIDELHRLKFAEVSAKRPDLAVHIAQGQLFEQANILRRLNPDIYIGRAADAVWAARSGIAAISTDHLPIMGYQGVTAVLHQLQKRLGNRSFVQKLQENTALPYRPGWYSKSSNWYIKQEVK